MANAPTPLYIVQKPTPLFNLMLVAGYKLQNQLVFVPKWLDYKCELVSLVTADSDLLFGFDSYVVLGPPAEIIGAETIAENKETYCTSVQYKDLLQYSWEALYPLSFLA